MSVRLHLARPEDFARLDPLVAAYHLHAGIESDASWRREALMPLLEGSPHGAVYLIGPSAAPLGYIAFGFGWSIEFGGLEAFVDEFFLREQVRGRGVGSEVLASILPMLDKAGVRALHLEVAPDNAPAARLYGRHGLRLRDGYHLMTRTARR